MKIAISVETTADLSSELLKQYDIHVIPYTVLLGEEVYLDGQITSTDIFEYVEKNKVLPRTSAINAYQYEQFFSQVIKEGYDAVIHFSLSSGMSSSCLNAENASKKFNNVYVIDSQSLSTGTALLAIYARELAEKGLPIEQIVAKAKERVPYVQASFVVHTLDYLYKGGRCSGIARLGAAILRIKPQIIVRDGKMTPAKKFFGRRSQAVAQYCKEVLETNPNPDLSIAFVTHTQATPEMVEIAKEALIKRGFKKIYETQAGATITSHCGPMTEGILFINQKEDE